MPICWSYHQTSRSALSSTSLICTHLLDGFTGETIYTEDQVEQLPKAKPCVEDGLDIKEGVIQERQLVQAILTEVATQTN